MDKKYNSYHTAIKTCFALGIQNVVLPDTFTNTIPRSTSQNWKDLDAQKFVGSEYASKVELEIEEVKLFLDERLKKLRIMFISFCRLYLSILHFIGKDNYKKLILQNKEHVIDLVNHLPVEFNRSLICKFLQIGHHQFQVWHKNRAFKCASSLIGYCTKRFPNQIAQKELNALKSIISRHRFQTWSIASIWGYAVKKDLISMSRTSWYRYCLRLGIAQKRKFKKKERKRISVRATQPNEIWHMDVSHFVTADHVKFYIYAVLDNFSRKVLAWNLSRELSAKMRLTSVKEAINTQFISLLSEQEIDLIVDGGTENNNCRVQNFIRHCGVAINKKIALKDVTFSNSMIEGSFKILKKFLRSRGEIHSSNIRQELEFFIKDYNYIRPHYQHQIYTPDEIHNNPAKLLLKPPLQKMKNDRLTANRMSCCKIV